MTKRTWPVLLVLVGCAASQPKPPPPAEEPLVLSADTHSHDDPSGDSTSGSGSSSPGDPPAIGGIVAGKSADSSSALRSVKPTELGSMQMYSVPSSDSFMGFPLRGPVSVTVSKGKIHRVNGGTDLSSCAQIISKLKEKYGSPASSEQGGANWKGSGWAMGVAPTSSCSILIQAD